LENIKDDRGYNQVWGDSESTRIRFVRRADAIIKQMNADGSGKSVMEIGCGTGKNCYYLATKTNYQVLGTDICVPFVDDARINYQSPNLRYEVLDFNQLEQFKAERFDYIIGNGILHHLYHHLDAALVNMRKLLKPGGKMIFWEPNIYNPYVYAIFSYSSLRVKASLEPDEMAFSKSFIHDKLDTAGYKNMDIQFKDFLLPGIPEVLIQPSIAIGAVAEQIPLVKMLSQSLFIVAEN
jgi:2-polyprenyl-3-methyl-5-hydroxy-6-metoxy-1,4-benzoquinol methylase